jgi:hypothetical protein
MRRTHAQKPPRKDKFPFPNFLSAASLILMKTSSASLAFALALAASSLVSLHAANPKVEETVVGPVGAGGLYVVSQNDARVAYVGAKGTRTVVSVDGVEGPVLDELFNGSAANISGAGPLLVHRANAGGKFNGTPTAVIFSETGSAYAYVGRQGNEYVVIHNGKEVGRGPRNDLSLQHSPLGLSPQGNFAFWGEMKTEGGRGTYRLLFNGKAEPWAGHQDLKPVFSPDDKHYAYTAGTVANYQKQMLIVDGKVASYAGFNPQWTADSKTLLTIGADNKVLVDGKPGPYAGISIEKITPSTVGGRFAVIMRKRLVNYQGVGTLYLDGKEVPGTDGAMDISFSPDGKHWALRCANPEARSFFVIIDGKKGNEYQSVADKFSWSPDSTKVVYQISSSGRNFVVVNTEEFPVGLVGSLSRDPIVFAKVGSRYAFSSTDGSNRQHLTIVDGKNILPAGLAPNGDSFDFSDDGSHYAFAVSPVGRNDSAGLVIDGKHTNELFVSGFTGTGWITPTRNTLFKWSPHGKYFARVARRPDNTAAGLYVNDQLAYPTTLQVSHPTFTPDGEHLYWIGAEKFPDRPQLYYMVYVDGQPIMKRDADGFLGYKEAWSVDAKGVLTFIAADGNQAKRYRVSPAAEMDVTKMLAATQEKIAKAEAEALAAKKKTEEDAAAKAAKAKADADELAAKRKAEAEAAAKARADAAAAKTKARQLQLENAKRKRQGLPPLTELP